MLGIADVSASAHRGRYRLQPRVSRSTSLESFHSLPHEPELLDIVESSWDGRPSRFPARRRGSGFPSSPSTPRRCTRTSSTTREASRPSPAGTPWGTAPSTSARWPCCPGSHKVKKVLPHHFALGAGGLIIDLRSRPRASRAGVPWLSTNFEAGDTLFFPALTVHKALPNITEDRMRISLDNRYEGEGDNIAAHMLEPHMNDISPLSWEEVYKDWKTDELKYYWLKMRHRTIPRYTGYMERGFAEALELARARDKRAILALRRAVKANPASEDAKKAAAVLEEIGLAQP